MSSQEDYNQLNGGELITSITGELAVRRQLSKVGESKTNEIDDHQTFGKISFERFPLGKIIVNHNKGRRLSEFNININIQQSTTKPLQKCVVIQKQRHNSI